MEEMYKQCELVRRAAGTVTGRMVTWIRSELAVKGYLLDHLKDVETGEFLDGWQVQDVTEPPLPESIIMKNVREYARFKDNDGRL